MNALKVATARRPALPAGDVEVLLHLVPDDTRLRFWFSDGVQAAVGSIGFAHFQSNRPFLLAQRVAGQLDRTEALTAGYESLGTLPAAEVMACLAQLPPHQRAGLSPLGSLHRIFGEHCFRLAGVDLMVFHVADDAMATLCVRAICRIVAARYWPALHSTLEHSLTHYANQLIAVRPDFVPAAYAAQVDALRTLGLPAVQASLTASDMQAIAQGVCAGAAQGRGVGAMPPRSRTGSAL